MRPRRALTKRQRKVLNYIRDYIAQRGFPPTLRELVTAFGWSSTNAASDHLRRIQARGWIEIAPNIARGIRVLERNYDQDADDPAEQAGGDSGLPRDRATA